MPSQRICRVFRAPPRVGSRQEVAGTSNPGSWTPLQRLEVEDVGPTGHDYVAVIQGRLGEVNMAAVVGSGHLVAEVRVVRNGAAFDQHSMTIVKGDPRAPIKGTQRGVPFQVIVPITAWGTGQTLEIEGRVRVPAGTPLQHNTSAIVEGLTVIVFDRTQLGATNEVLVHLAPTPTQIGTVGAETQMLATGVLPYDGVPEIWVVFWQARLRPGAFFASAQAWLDRVDGIGGVEAWEVPPLGIGSRTDQPVPTDDDRYCVGNVASMVVSDAGSQFRLWARDSYTRGPLNLVVANDDPSRAVVQVAPVHERPIGSQVQLVFDPLGVNHQSPGTILTPDRIGGITRPGLVNYTGLPVNLVSPVGVASDYDRARLWALRTKGLNIEYVHFRGTASSLFYGVHPAAGSPRPEPIRLESAQQLQASVEAVVIAGFCPRNTEQRGRPVSFTTEFEVTQSFGIDNPNPLYVLERFGGEVLPDLFAGHVTRVRGLNSLDATGLINPFEDQKRVNVRVLGVDALHALPTVLRVSPPHGLATGLIGNLVVNGASGWQPDINGSRPVRVSGPDRLELLGVRVAQVGNQPSAQIRIGGLLVTGTTPRGFLAGPRLIAAFRTHLDDESTIGQPPAQGVIVPVIPGREAELDLSNLPVLPFDPLQAIGLGVVSDRGELRTLDGYLITWPSFLEPRFRSRWRWVRDEKRGEDAMSVIDWLRAQKQMAFRYALPGDEERAYVAIGSSLSGPIALEARVYETHVDVVELEWIGA